MALSVPRQHGSWVPLGPPKSVCRILVMRTFSSGKLRCCLGIWCGFFSDMAHFAHSRSAASCTSLLCTIIPYKGLLNAVLASVPIFSGPSRHLTGHVEITGQNYLWFVIPTVRSIAPEASHFIYFQIPQHRRAFVETH